MKTEQKKEIIRKQKIFNEIKNKINKRKQIKKKLNKKAWHIEKKKES